MEFMDFHRNKLTLPKGRDVVKSIAGYGIIENEGKILIIKDGRGGHWEFPGGKNDPGESVVDGTKREILEETGFTVALESQPIHLSEQLFYHNQKDIYFHAHGLFFRGKLVSEEQQEQNLAVHNEISQVKWVTMDQLRQISMHQYFDGAKQKLFK